MFNILNGYSVMSWNVLFVRPIFETTYNSESKEKRVLSYSVFYSYILKTLYSLCVFLY